MLKQTYQNIEIIIINDGSTDDTLKIAQQYEKRHPKKIKVFSQKNHGLGYTRNVALSYATGDYFVNLDSDDWLKDDYVERMLRVIQDNDIAICGFERYDQDYQFRDRRVPEVNDYAKFKFCTTAGKMFRTEFVRKNKLQYDITANMGEDAKFNIIAYSNTSHIVVIKYSGYCCYEVNTSVTHTAVYDDHKSFYALAKFITSKVTPQFVDDPNFTYWLYKNLLMDVFIYKDSLSAKKLITVYRRSVQWYRKFLKQHHLRWRLRFQKGEAFKINLVINGLIVLTKLRLDGAALRILKKTTVSVL